MAAQSFNHFLNIFHILLLQEIVSVLLSPNLFIFFLKNYEKIFIFYCYS